MPRKVRLRGAETSRATPAGREEKIASQGVVRKGCRCLGVYSRCEKCSARRSKNFVIQPMPLIDVLAPENS